MSIREWFERTRLPEEKEPPPPTPLSLIAEAKQEVLKMEAQLKYMQEFRKNDD
jgi:hypothetical protein